MARLTATDAGPPNTGGIVGHIPSRDEEPNHEPTPQTGNGNDRARTIGGLVVLAVILGSCYVTISSSDGGSDSGDDWGAHNACTQFVERRLRAPATADFPSHRQADISRSGDRWTVRSHVDAENAFGASIRTDWTCTVSRTDGGWEGSATLLE